MNAIGEKFDWNEVYDHGEDWSDTAPSDYVEDALSLLRPDAYALDIGCGNGRNSIFLAKKGIKVEAFDISATAIRRLQLKSRQMRLKHIISYQADLLYWQRRKRFDLIILHGVLNSLPLTEVPGVLQYVNRRLSRDGVIFVSIFHPVPGKSSLDGVNLIGDIESSLIEKAFQGHDLLKRDIRIFSHAHGLLPEHTHCIERFLYRKSI